MLNVESLEAVHTKKHTGNLVNIDIRKAMYFMRI